MNIRAQVSLEYLILSAVAETPVVAVSYGRKVTQLMADLGLSDYCMELPTFRTEQLHNAVSCALQNRKKLLAGLALTLVKYRKELDFQYGNIQRLLVGNCQLRVS